MRTSIWTRLIVTALALCVAAILAAPASALTLRRDGSKAVPFKPVVSEQSALPATSVGGDGLDWGDAAIGVGIGTGATLLVVAGLSAVRGRPLRTPRPRSGAVSG